MSTTDYTTTKGEVWKLRTYGIDRFADGVSPWGVKVTLQDAFAELLALRAALAKEAERREDAIRETARLHLENEMLMREMLEAKERGDG